MSKRNDGGELWKLYLILLWFPALIFVLGALAWWFNS